MLFGAMLASCMLPIRPLVFPTLESMPSDTRRRGEYLETTEARARPEGNTRVPAKVQTLQTTVATMAAILGALLSAGNDAAVGVSFSFDENALFDASPRRATPAPPSRDHENVYREPGAQRRDKLPLLPVPNPTR